jgi:hypothetical protein
MCSEHVNISRFDQVDEDNLYDHFETKRIFNAICSIFCILISILKLKMTIYVNCKYSKGETVLDLAQWPKLFVDLEVPIIQTNTFGTLSLIHGDNCLGLDI